MVMNIIAFFIISLIGYLAWRIASRTVQMKAVPVYLKNRREIR